MLRTLRITSFVAAFLAVCFLGLSVAFGLRSDPEITEFLKSPGAIEKFKATAAKSKKTKTKVSPLVKQAQAFALLINPPKPAKPKTQPRTRPAVETIETITPPVVHAKFELIGTCRYQLQPDRSLALIDEPGKGIHWVRQAGKVGHLMIEQIKDGSLIYRDGQRTEEIFAKRPKKTSLLQGGSPTPAPAGEETPSPPPTPRLSPRQVSTTLREPKRPGPVQRPAPKPAKPPSREQAREGIDWLRKMMTDPKSMGISEEEAKNLGDLGEIIKDLEHEAAQAETEAPKVRPDPNVTGP